jgi:hypothetical protein
MAHSAERDATGVAFEPRQHRRHTRGMVRRLEHTPLRLLAGDIGHGQDRLRQTNAFNFP